MGVPVPGIAGSVRTDGLQSPTPHFGACAASHIPTEQAVQLVGYRSLPHVGACTVPYDHERRGGLGAKGGL